VWPICFFELVEDGVGLLLVDLGFGEFLEAGGFERADAMYLLPT
jgi:hypothetical protein